MKRETYKQARLINRINSTAALISRKSLEIVDLVRELDEHTANRIAAHKAHHTMKKRKLVDMKAETTYGVIDPRTKGRAERHRKIIDVRKLGLEIQEAEERGRAR